MKQNGLSQEGLKLFACVIMLVDHIGAVLVPVFSLRIIGRIAFPIFCFLLAEGVAHTKNPQKYAMRLLIGALLSEIPFDLALFGRMTWQYQNVMLTMALGFCALEVMKHAKGAVLQALLALPFLAAAELLRTDYGAGGVLMILLFGLTRYLPYRNLWQTVCLALLCIYVMPGAMIPIGGIRVGVEVFAVLAMIPIAMYDGRKVTGFKAVQWAFYLFYPAHLTALYLIRLLIN